MNYNKCFYSIYHRISQIFKLGVILVALLVLGTLSSCSSHGKAENDPGRELSSSAPYEVSVYYADGSEETFRTDEIDFNLIFDQVEQGYYCYSLQDAQGTEYSIEKLASLSKDCIPDSLYQKCAVKLSDEHFHKAYYFPNEKGEYDLDAPLTKSVTATMFGALLTRVPDGILAQESDNTDEVRLGAVVMQYYGMSEEDSFIPDDTVTLGELLYYISFCFPPTDGDYSFADLSADHPYYNAMCLAAENGWIKGTESHEETPSIKETLFLMNRVLKREASVESFGAEVYSSYVDYLDDADVFCNLVEAGVTHTCSETNPEKWEDSIVFRKLEPGLRWNGNILYCVCDDGRFAVNEEVNGLLFDNEGKYTSGDKELDRLVLEVLDEILQDDMTQYEKLRAVYVFTMKKLQYIKGKTYEKGTDDWWPEAALKMLSVKKGNCFSFAAAFCALSRPLGYNTKVSSGSNSFNGSGIHSWAYIMFDDGEHIFDPQAEKTKNGRDMFDMSPERWKKFYYDPVYYLDTNN